MKAEQLFPLAGGAALLGGALRMAAAFPLGLGPTDAETLYTAIDMLLLLGLMGIYLSRAEKLGFLGLAAFAIAVAALSLIGGPDANPWGFSTYQEGATVLAIAMAAMSLAWFRARAGSLIPPLCWFGSLIAGGVASAIPGTNPALGLAAAGFLFGLGFAAAGVELIRSPPRASST